METNSSCRFSTFIWAVLYVVIRAELGRAASGRWRIQEICGASWRKFWGFRSHLSGSDVVKLILFTPLAWDSA